MKILSVSQIRQLDAFTIENEAIRSIDLMERASQAFVKAFTQRYPPDQSVYVFCGLGNNGGDGLVVSRLLRQAGYPVQTWIVRHTGQSSPDFQANYQRLQEEIPDNVHDLTAISGFPEISADALIIDALFGSGLSRPLENLPAEVVGRFNQRPARVVALDMPSGLLADQSSEGTAITQAHHTITFQLPKLAFLLPPECSLRRALGSGRHWPQPLVYPTGPQQLPSADPPDYPGFAPKPKQVFA
ncbi:MAG: NAD(P)H-hydrate epimerase [Bacteroidia bacterium]|nr:NAD(P)H-hydrate epimerase [Bacteroidia bacterium]